MPLFPHPRGDDRAARIRQVIEDCLRTNGEPMHVKALTQAMIATGEWEAKGSTPDATVGAKLYVDIKQKGGASLFVKTGPNVFGLKKN